MTKKLKQVEFTIADAISVGTSELESLRDELQEWYDNLPENFQNGDKGDQLQTAIDGLNAIDSYSTIDAVDSGADDGDEGANGYIGGVKFMHVDGSKKRMSRAARCSEAVSLLRDAIAAGRNEIGDAPTGENEIDPFADTRDDIEANLDELENLCDEADSVEFPSMFG